MYRTPEIMLNVLQTSHRVVDYCLASSHSTSKSLPLPLPRLASPVKCLPQPRQYCIEPRFVVVQNCLMPITGNNDAPWKCSVQNTRVPAWVYGRWMIGSAASIERRLDTHDLTTWQTQRTVRAMQLR